MDKTLDILRQSIDHLDSALMFVLAERTHAIFKVGVLKKHLHCDFSYSDEREQDLQKVIRMGEEQKLNREFLQKLFACLYQEALNRMNGIDEDDAVSIQSYLDLQLESLRTTLYNLDVTLCHLLAERFHLARQIGQYKKSHQQPILAPGRWEQVLVTKKKMAAELGINPNFIEEVMNIIHAASIADQKV